MLVLVIVLGGLLCLTLVIVVVLAAFVHVLRNRAKQKPAPGQLLLLLAASIYNQ